MTIGYGPPPTTAAPTMHYGCGPVEQRENPPLGPTTHTTRAMTVCQLKMDSPQKHKDPAKGRDPVNSKGDRGTESNQQKYSQEPVQGLETGRAKERKRHSVDNSLDLTVGVSTQGASQGSNKKKSRDLEIVDTGHTSTCPLPQAVVDSTDPPHQAGSDMDRSPTGYEGLCVVNMPRLSEYRPNEHGPRTHYVEEKPITTPSDRSYRSQGNRTSPISYTRPLTHSHKKKWTGTTSWAYRPRSRGSNPGF